MIMNNKIIIISTLSYAANGTTILGPSISALASYVGGHKKIIISGHDSIAFTIRTVTAYRRITSRYLSIHAILYEFQ